MRQYVCSGVSGDGPAGSFNGCKGVTGAAIMFRGALHFCNTKVLVVLVAKLAQKSQETYLALAARYIHNPAPYPQSEHDIDILRFSQYLSTNR